MTCGGHTHYRIEDDTNLSVGQHHGTRFLST